MKLRSFQYKLLLNAIVTNIQLKRYGVRQDNFCSFCNIGKESYKHLFFECKYVYELWRFLDSRLHNVKLNFVNVFTNKIGFNPKQMESSIVLITKYYIYKTRCMNERISVTSCVNYIKNYVLIEEQIAKEKGKTQLHIRKWQDLKL